jgi:hypothetical protein
MKSIYKKAELEAKLKKLQSDLVNLEKSASFKKEQALVRGVEKLLAQHGKTKAELISFLSDGAASSKKKSVIKKNGQRKQRKLKVYKNPKTGEVVETRGGNHRILKAWKAKYKMESVEGWIIEEK